MKTPFFISIFLISVSLVAQNNEPYSKRMANSQMARSGTIQSWDYPNGLFVESVLKVYDKYGDQQYRDYAISHANATINSTGKIGGYSYSAFNIDDICPGMFLLRVNELVGIGNPKYRIALDTLRKQVQNQPRNSLGGFWHKKVYPNQMWLDGIFMGSRFYAKYDLTFNGGQNLDDVINQFSIIHSKTYDPAKQLNYHAWAENPLDPNAFWSKQDDPFRGCSHEFWSRGNGWFFAALVDVIELIPQNHPRRPEMLNIINQVAAGIKRWQEPNTGLWYQLTEYDSTTCVNSKCNYLEASASSMFTYSLLKAVRLGMIPSSEYYLTAKKAYQGLTTYLVSEDNQGRLSLNKICRSAGLGPANNPSRNGTIAYYLTGSDAGTIVSNDLKGVGPFIMASVEYETAIENETAAVKTQKKK